MRAALRGAVVAIALLAPWPLRAQSDEAFDAETARRYREIVDRDPGGDAVYRRLVEHYGRGPGVAELVREYAERAAGDGRDSFAVRLLLGRLLRTAGRFDEAEAELSAAAALDPASPHPARIGAEMAKSRRDGVRARELYERALALTRGKDDRESLLKVLASMALDARDIPGARAHVEMLKRERPGDRFLRAQLARLYAAHGATEASLDEWRAIREAARGRPAEIVEAHKEIGALLLALDRGDEAEAAYRQALALVSADNWNVREIRERLVEIRRRKDDLRSLLAEFERAWARKGFDEWRLLARLNDEVGREEQAIAAYRRAIAARGRDADVRLALIRLLERLGRVDAVAAEYKALIAAFPGETRYAIELADLLYRRQEPSKAVRILDDLAKRRQGDAQALSALADAFTRYGENERALRAYGRLVKLEPGEETHLISLGEQQSLMGDPDRAQATWRRVLTVMADKAKAWQLLGETYASHDMPADAVRAFQEAVAVRPDDPALLRSLALSLDRVDDRAAAVETWERVHRLAADGRLRKEAREWIVRLHQALGRLPGKVEEWRQVSDRAKALEARAPAAAEGEERRVWEAERAQQGEASAEAGRLLADGLITLDRSVEAEAVLEALLTAHPGDVDSLEAIEELYLARNDLTRAIDVLTRIAELNPYRAREYYQRVAEFSLRVYKDDDAVRFAGLAVDINPDDSEAHARLARIFHRMQDLEAAAREYGKAVDLDRLNFDAAFELASVLRDLGRPSEADAQYREVVRRAADDELVLKAARKSLHLNLMAGTLDALERDVAPLLWRTPPRPVFRRIVTELYGDVVRPLRERVRFGRGAEVEAARRELAALGRRAVKPLLEALTDEDAGLRLGALDVLADLGHGDASIPLGQLMDEREARVRVRTAVVLGRIGDVRGIGALRRGIADGDQGVRAASAWALGAIGGPRAASALLELVTPPSSDRKWGVRAVAAAALGRAGDRRAVPALMALLSAEAADSKEEVRAAAAWALGRLDPDRAAPALLTSMEVDTLLVRRLAARSLAGRRDRRASMALLAALWTGEAGLRVAAAAALAGQGPEDPDAGGPPPGFIGRDGGRHDVTAYVEELARPPAVGPQAGPARLLELLQTSPDAVREAVAGALRSDPGDVAALALRDLDARPDGPALGPLTSGEIPPELGDRLARTLGSGAVIDALVGLVGADDERVRARAVSVLGKLGGGGARAVGVVGEALGDPAAEVRRAAVEALGRLGTGRSEALLRRGLSDPAWAVRAEAAAALSRAGGPGAADALVGALRDPFPFVRESAARGLGALGGDGGIVRALTAALSDRSAPVRAGAAWALGELRDPSAADALDALRADEEVLVREAGRAAADRLAR